MKKVYKAHPIMVLKLLKPILFILLLPVIRAPLQYIVRGEIDGLLMFEILFFAAIILIAVLRCLAFRVIYEEDRVIIKTGILLKRLSEIDISKLSSVQTVRNPMDIIFGAMTFCINTEAGTKNKPDFEFKLKFKEGKELANMLYGGETFSKQRISAFKVALLSAATSSAFTGMIIGVPLINKAGNLLGLALSDMLLNEINNLSSKIETHFPPIVNTLSLILLLGYGISFVYSFLKFLNFRIVFGEKKFEVRSGLITKRRTAFSRASVNDLKIEQTALMILFKQFSMKVSVGGFGETKGESQVVIPCGKYKELMQDFSRYFPFLAPDGKALRAKKGKLQYSRFLYWPTVYLLVTLAVSIPAIIIFDELTRFFFFLTLICLFLIFYYAYVCSLEYIRNEVCFGKNIFARSKNGLRTYELYCPQEKVGQIKITRFFTDFYYKTCKVRITVCSEAADSILLRHLDYNESRTKIYECFGIKE